MTSFSPLLTSRNKIWFVLFDWILFINSIALAAALQGRFLPPYELLRIEFALWLLVIPSAFYIFGNYDLDYIASFKSLIFRQLPSFVLIFSYVAISVYFIAPRPFFLWSPQTISLSLALFFILSLAYRFAFLLYFHRIKGQLKWLILGDSNLQNIIRQDFSALQFEGTLEYFDLTQSFSALRETFHKPWSTIVIPNLGSLPEQKLIGELIIEAKCSGLNTMSIVEFYEKHLMKVPLALIDYNWFINAGGFYTITQPLQLRLKRLADLFFAIILGAALLPVLVLVYCAIRLESKGPGLYSQVRTGKDGRPFRIYKFRSMVVDAEKDGAKWASKNDNRVTRIGRFIRATRIDELPQLWNVIRGDMSFIGPRPERPEFNEKLKQEIPYYDLRHMLRPGLTGWAQVLYPYGASALDSKEKLQYELYYIKHSGITLDLAIVLKTIGVVFGARGR